MAMIIIPNLISEANSRGLPWECRLEYTGYNDGNLSGRSSKFWSIERIGAPPQNRECIVRWGAIGSAGQVQRKPYQDCLNKLYEKLAKGYKPVAGALTVLPGATPAPVPPKPAAPPPVPAVVLPEPYCRIVKVVPRALENTYAAIDAQGVLVMNLSEAGVKKLVGMAPLIGLASGVTSSFYFPSEPAF